MRTHFLALLAALLSILPQVVRAQEIDVEAEQFPGAKRVKVESFRGPGGYWAEYQLDARGRATERRGYCRREHLSTEQYSFTRRRELQQERVTEPGKDKRVQVFSYHYQYSPDSARIIRKVGRSDADTMFVVHYLGFDQENHPVKFTKAEGWSRKVDSETQITYSSGRLASYRRTDYGEEGSTVHSVTYKYNSRGNLTKESRAISPAPPATFWMDGQGDVSEYDYDYSPKGPWTHQYQFFSGKKVLVEKRTFTY